MMKQVLDVDGMRCGSCEKLVGEELSELAGVRVVQADSRLGTVALELDEQHVPMAQVVDLIRELGFSVSMTDG
jgi:copper chaperone